MTSCGNEVFINQPSDVVSIIPFCYCSSLACAVDSVLPLLTTFWHSMQLECRISHILTWPKVKKKSIFQKEEKVQVVFWLPFCLHPVQIHESQRCSSACILRFLKCICPERLLPPPSISKAAPHAGELKLPSLLVMVIM